MNTLKEYGYENILRIWGICDNLKVAWSRIGSGLPALTTSSSQMPRLWEERVGRFCRNGTQSQTGEEAVGGSGRWGYRLRTEREFQKIGNRGRGIGKEAEKSDERWRKTTLSVHSG